jgi:hypothetical protein
MIFIIILLDHYLTSTNDRGLSAIELLFNEGLFALSSSFQLKSLLFAELIYRLE